MRAAGRQGVINNNKKKKKDGTESIIERRSIVFSRGT
jgi:hypothetical protein